MVEQTLSAAGLPKLVVLLPDGKEVHHAIAGAEITIGRDPSNRIVLADNFVSKFHAKLVVSGSSLTLVDLGSANKTYVNGSAVTTGTPVRYGDEIQFAGVRCRLLGPESAKPAAAPARAPGPPPVAPPEPSAPKKKPPAPAVAPARARPPSAAPRGGISTPPPIEADPMKRLLRIGGLLILVSGALGVLLRVMLVPGASPPASESESAAPATTSAPATEPGPAPTTSAPAASTLPSASARGGSAEEYFDQALSYLDTGRLKEAQTAFRKVLEIDPDHPRARTRLSLLDEEIQQKAERHFGNARQAFQFLRYDEAIAEWEMFLTLADASDVRYAEAQQGIEQAKAKLR